MNSIYFIKVLKAAEPCFSLHNVREFLNFYKNGQKRVPTHVGRPFSFFWAKYFGISKNGQKKCPKIKKAKYFAQKGGPCDHN
jgi:hypothetical protein